MDITPLLTPLKVRIRVLQRLPLVRSAIANKRGRSYSTDTPASPGREGKEKEKRGRERNGTSELSLAQRIPSGSWDSHMHVVEPQRYPISSNAVYTPSPHTLPEARTFYATLGIENLVLVQPSIYGFDNSCLLDALKEVGPSHGRGVVVIDPETTKPETLAEWHQLGVRGVRLNLKSVGKVMTGEELSRTLERHAALIRPLGWMVQLYVSMDMVSAIEHIVPTLGVKVCVDHFGAPAFPSDIDYDSFDPYSLPGFSSLVSLLQTGQTYVKLSAPYRFSRDPQMRDIGMLAQELLRVAPTRVVYSTDWPHTRFSMYDIRPFTEMCLEWCAKEPGLAERLFRINAEELWGVDGTEKRVK